MVDLICLALKLQGAKVTVQFILYLNLALTDNELTTVLGFIDDILSYTSFIDLRDLQTNCNGELRDKYNNKGLQGTSCRGQLKDKKDNKIIFFINKAIAEGTQLKLRGVNSETIITNIH